MTLVNKKLKRGYVWNAIIITIALGILSILPISMITQASENLGDDDDNTILERRANLVSPSGNVNPNGEAEFEVYQNGNKELEIEAEDLNLANGTSLSFYLEGVLLGQAIVQSQEAEFKLKTENGDNVPNVNDGDFVEVKNGGTLLLSGVFSGGGGPTPSPSGSPSPGENEIYATLTGATINGILPRGYAEYEVEGTNDREFEVYVDRISLPNGTPLNIVVDGVSVGTLFLEDEGEGELELETEDGHAVPVISDGSTVEVRNGGTVILSGTFNGGGGGNPTPSPSGQGRKFEGHLNGSNVVPPVSTNADGEIEILLNQNETVATIHGEFDDLSSPQTSATVNVTIGGVTTVVYDLGTLGGTEGHFPLQTFSVTADQVQQLRTGLWFAVIGSQNHPNGEIAGQIEIDSSNSDFDGDGSNDFSVFRPSNGTWYSDNSLGFSAQTFGTASDTPVSADFDGDGRSDLAVFRNVGGNGVWEIKRSSDGGITATQFGFATDKPVRGDFDGDGINDLAVFRPSTGVWYVRKSNNTGFIITKFGISTDTPVSGDFDGDGKNDIAVWRESTGVWYWINSSNGSVSIVKWGINGDKPVAGDFDGDGRTDLTVYRPNTGVWYINRSSDNNFDIRRFGISEDIPVAGMYDGDDRTDIAVFRPSTGVWYIWKSSDNSYSSRQFGLTGDIPTITQ